MLSLTLVTFQPGSSFHDWKFLTNVETKSNFNGMSNGEAHRRGRGILNEKLSALMALPKFMKAASRSKSDARKFKMPFACCGV